MSTHGSREEAEDYAALQSDLKRYGEVCSEIKSLEYDNGAWAAGRFYNDAVKLANERLASLRREQASLERLCAGHIQPASDAGREEARP